MKYVSTFVMPVPTNKLDVYRRTTRKFAKIWKEHGALEVVETIGDDVEPGKLTSFPRSVMLERNETIAVSWLTFKSRAHRDRVMKKFMSDPRAQELMASKDIPIDGKRMFWGGFDVIVRL